MFTSTKANKVPMFTSLAISSSGHQGRDYRDQRPEHRGQQDR
jgi:hypothetical protein